MIESLIPVLTLLSVVVLSLIVVRVASVALTLTGLSRDLARFEARSAFTGTGFTSSDSEKVVGHPVRRQIIMWLMLAGNAGFVTVVSSLILSMMGTDGSPTASSLGFRIFLMLVGIVVLWFAAHSQWIDRRMCDLIELSLRRFTNMDLHDYVDLLHVGGDYAVAEVAVHEQSWLRDRSLIDLCLTKEGVVVLGIERIDGQYVGTPSRDARLKIGENVIMYGPRETIANLDSRPVGEEGDAAHTQFSQFEQERNAKLRATQPQ